MIFDCFPFWNELDVLDIRLHELASVVDYFVIVEALVTHGGRVAKPLHFADNCERFAWCKDKIRPCLVNHMPVGPDSWARENWQRNAIGCLLKELECQPNDVVMISDADEIPSAEAVRSYRPEIGLRACEQAMYYYWLNCRGGFWCGTRMLSYQDFLGYPNATAIRYTASPVIKNAGWHFSYLGGPSRIKEKLAAFCHHDLDRPEFNDETYLRLCVNSTIDLFQRPGAAWAFEPLGNTFPFYVLKHKYDTLRHLWRDAMFNENWYPDSQLVLLAKTYEMVRGLTGAILDIGVWEGKSTVALANACYPEVMLAIDHWQGSKTEGEGHPTCVISKQRDVMARFRKNVAELTQNNIEILKGECNALLHCGLAPLAFGPVKFSHIDAAHDYPSVRRTIELLLPLMVPGGVLCGDDFQSASAQREDLQGGVERAVREMLPGFVQTHNFWHWRKPA